MFRVLMLIALACAAFGQPAVYFTNRGPGFNAPFHDTYGCLLDSGWRADLVAGPTAFNLAPVSSAASLLDSNACGTGFFNGGIVAVPGAAPDGTIYTQVRVWTGAETFQDALETNAPRGWTPVLAVEATNSGPVYLTGLRAAVVGPLTPWFMREVFSDVYFYSRHPFLVPAGHEIEFVVVIPLLAYRNPSNFQWQKLNSNSNWVDIAGANTNSLHLTSIGPEDAAQYRVVFNFGCGCDDQISEADVTVIGMDSPEGLTLNGPAGGQYRVEYKDELAGTNTWQTLTNIFLSTGSISRIDPRFPNSSQRFYRVAYLP